MSIEPKESKKETVLSWLGKHLAGMGIITAIGTVGGAIYGATRKKSIASNAKIGAGIGAVASLGFGKIIYDAATGADKAEIEISSYAERIAKERISKNQEHQR